MNANGTSAAEGSKQPPPILTVIMTPETHPEHFASVFGDIADLERFVPWMAVPKDDGKVDKRPHNGRRGLSTSEPSHWMPMTKAGELAHVIGLSGIGIVMTGGIEIDGWVLVGGDVDKATDEFVMPFDTYAECSPSGKGIRFFCLVPADFAAEYRDTMDAKFIGCDHAELYLGTAPRFLTVTFNAINDCAIARLR